MRLFRLPPTRTRPSPLMTTAIKMHSSQGCARQKFSPPRRSSKMVASSAIRLSASMTPNTSKST